jgi:hypothetical protein
MLATAMSTNPWARASGLIGRPLACETVAASSAKRWRTTSASSGSSAPGPNTPREVRRLDSAQHHIGIGHGQRPAPPIAWPGPGCAPRSSPARPAAGCHRNGRIEPPPAATVWMLIIGARMRTPATSVSNARSNSPAKCDTSVDVPPMSKPITRSNPRRLAQPCHHADDPAGRPGQDRILALEGAGIGQPAIGLHELQSHAVHGPGHLLDVAAKDRRQIGIDDGGIAAGDELDQGRDLMRHRNLGETDLAG